MNTCLYCNKPLGDKNTFGLHNDCFKQAFNISSIDQFQDWQRKEAISKDAPHLPEKPYLSSFFAGNYRKYEASLLGTRYIFKLGNPDCPELAPVEYLCNVIGKRLGIPVPEPFALIQENNELAFVTKNFTQDIHGHHNLVHLYHYLPEGEDHYNVKNILETIGQQTQNAKDIHIFLEVLIFDALVGNHDRHGRNLAFLETGNGKRLSPIYDNTSALGLETGKFLLADWNPRGKIAVAHTKEPTLKDYLREIRRLGYFDSLAQFIGDFPGEEISNLIREAAFLSNNMRTAFHDLFRKRAKEFEDAY
jgi:hypothetical protein